MGVQLYLCQPPTRGKSNRSVPTGREMTKAVSRPQKVGRELPCEARGGCSCRWPGCFARPKGFVLEILHYLETLPVDFGTRGDGRDAFGSLLLPRLTRELRVHTDGNGNVDLQFRQSLATDLGSQVESILSFGSASIGLRLSNGRGPPGRGRRVPRNRREVWRLAYKTLQALFDTNRSKAVQLVLSGDWSRLENPRIPTSMEGFRRQLFETPSVPDRREAVPIRDTKWNLVKPITVSEIDAMLKGMSNGATGLDRITLRQLIELKAIPTALLARMFNLWLVAEALPEQLQKGRTSFIPIAPGDLAPPKFRPITVSSFITRLIHRTLAKRF